MTLDDLGRVQWLSMVLNRVDNEVSVCGMMIMQSSMVELHINNIVVEV